MGTRRTVFALAVSLSGCSLVVDTGRYVDPGSEPPSTALDASDGPELDADTASPDLRRPHAGDASAALDGGAGARDAAAADAGDAGPDARAR